MRRIRPHYTSAITAATAILAASLLLPTSAARAKIIPIDEEGDPIPFQPPGEMLFSDEILDGPVPPMAFIGRRRYNYSEPPAGKCAAFQSMAMRIRARPLG